MNVKNNVLVTGRIAHDLELKVTENGRKVLNFNVAVDDGTKEKPHVTYLPCEAWEGTAEVIGKYFGKGDQIIIGGRLVNRKVIDRGENRYRININVESFEFGAKKRKEEAPKAKTTFTYDDVDTSIGDEDFPW